MGDDQESVRATRGSRIASFRGGSAAGLLANSILSFFGRWKSVVRTVRETVTQVVREPVVKTVRRTVAIAVREPVVKTVRRTVAIEVRESVVKTVGKW